MEPGQPEEVTGSCDMSSLLREIEGPAFPVLINRRDRSPARLDRPWAGGRLLLIVGGIAAISAFGAVMFLNGSDPPRESSSTAAAVVSPPPVSATGSDSPPGPNVTGLVGGHNVQGMIERADLIFIGEVFGRPRTSVTVSPCCDDGPALHVDYVRFTVLERLVGDSHATVDLAQFADAEAAYPAVVGQRYLVFAWWRELGSTRTRALVPIGYAGGVFVIGQNGTARNEVFGEVAVEDVAKRVRAARN